MQILSALDAISPAFSRTRLVLFSPFRLGRTWKLSATAYLATAGSVFLPFPLFYLAFVPFARQAGVPYVVPVLIAVSVVGTLVYLVVFYLISRLRFAYFDIVLNRGQFVAPGWRKYGPPSFQWTAFKVVLGSVLAAAVAAPMVGYIRYLVQAFSALNLAPGEQPPPAFIASIFSAYAAIFLVYVGFGLFYWASSLLSDFIVPSLALENTTLGEAFRRLSLLIRNEPGQFAAYAFVKLGLAIAGYFAMVIASYIVILIVGVVVGIIALLGYLVLHALGASTTVLVALGVILGVALYLFFIFYVVFLGAGTVLTFLESYLLYFLGGRYPMLGGLLEASTPPPVRSTPVYPAYTPPPPPPAS
jgi:hypothetical protein